MAKIPTPALATLVNDLPTLDGSETGKSILVTTNQGLRKVDWNYFKAFNNYLIGQILAYPFGAFLEQGFIPLLGGVLKPSWFKDSLAILKRRCPNWVDAASGNVNLPNLQNKVLQSDFRLYAFAEETDAVQNWSKSFTQGNHSVGNASVGAGHINTGNTVSNFSLSSVVRTANETRENTQNIVWCIYAGELVDESAENLFYKVNYSSGLTESAADATNNIYPYIRLYRPLSEAEGIGYNASIMQRAVGVVDPWDKTKVVKEARG